MESALAFIVEIDKLKNMGCVGAQIGRGNKNLN